MSLPIITVEDELAAFEAQARAKLGLKPEDDGPQQWHEPVPQTFTADQRAHTTVLHCGLTVAHDLFIVHALRGVGYNILNLDPPDTESLRYGKEFGNRGQCNPTYFTVGNLIKYLSRLRDGGMTTREIIEKYVFVTAGACGPCRFGTYVTEYRKALRDAGFDGFRILQIQQQGGLDQAEGVEDGFQINAELVYALIKAIMVGDVLNAVGYRIRPYEVKAGATNRALEECKAIISRALESRSNVLIALMKARRILADIEVDKTAVKPKVAIIGEFWAMTTEGDGNYHLPKFLEAEGAEVDVQLVAAWLLYNVWEVTYDTRDRMFLREHDTANLSLNGIDAQKRLLMLKATDLGIRAAFQTFANLIGLHGYHLPDMDELAEVSHEFYDNHVRGGEGHMEVAKLILNVLHSKVNMTLSVKPFGCMPSSGVSDGVQSKVTELHPSAIYCPIETTGDGAVNVQSRVQMMLFKAKQAARRETDAALAKSGLTLDEAREILGRVPFVGRALFQAPHRHGATSADMIALAGALKNPLAAVRSFISA